MMEVMLNRFKDWVKKINPCEQDEDSFIYRLLATIFPDCWCCSGLRGTVYGIIIASIFWGILFKVVL